VLHILYCLASDVDWERDTLPNPMPWLQPLKGRDLVHTFFEALQSGVDIAHFQPTQFFSDENTVVVLVDLEFTVRATGKRVVEPNEVHI
jgi:ketosteroid isomerase-like protein